MAAIGGFLAFVALHADAVYGVVVVVCRIVLAKVPDRMPALPLGAAALAVIAGGLAIAAAWSTPAGLITGTVLMAGSAAAPSCWGW